MLKFVLASRNKKKIRELETFLAGIPSDKVILSLDDIGYHDEIVEDGKTFAENSLIKASVPAKLGYIGVADDSGLEVDALNGAPGVYSARYSGEGATDEKNISLAIILPSANTSSASVSNISFSRDDVMDVCRRRAVSLLKSFSFNPLSIRDMLSAVIPKYLIKNSAYPRH